MQRQRQTVFVVEGDDDSRVLLGELLELEGLRPRLFRATEDVLAALVLGEELPMLLIADLHVRGMAGAALLESVRREPRWCHIPIVVFTGWSDVAAAAGLGIPIVHKPNVEGLLGAIRAVRGQVAAAAQSPPRPSIRESRRASNGACPWASLSK